MKIISQFSLFLLLFMSSTALFGIIFMDSTVLFQLTFTFIYNIFNIKFLVSAKSAVSKQILINIKNLNGVKCELIGANAWR